MSVQAVVPAEFREATERSSVTMLDVLAVVLILAFGIFAFVFHRRAADFVGEDVFYADCARSLIERGFYGIGARLETTQPPGLPAILALLFVNFGYSYSLCLQTMAVFSTLGFVATYALLKCRMAQLVAFCICVLLLSSHLYFRFETQEVYPMFPFFFTTMSALLIAEEYEKAATLASRFAWGLLLAVIIGASQMLVSAGMALMAAMVAVVCITFVRDRRFALVRLRRLLPIVLVGLTVQAMWMLREPAPREWSLPGYPAPYFQQLKVKSGNYPELGMATLSDIPVRIWENATDQADTLASVLVHRGIKRSKLFIVIIPISLVAIGWAYSVWETRGSLLLEWYFAAYEFIYLLWPWNGARFFLPVAPLACFYLWVGLKAVYLLAIKKPRPVGIFGAPICALLGISGWRWIHAHWEHGLGRFPDEVIAPIWCLLALAATWMAGTGRPLPFLLSTSRIGSWFQTPLDSLGVRPLRLGRHGAVCIVVLLVALGVSLQAHIARENLNFTELLRTGGTAVNSMAFEVEGATWIRSHTPADSVVMARHVPTVYHYSQRKLVWFAPVSNADVLMQGIVKHKVNYVVVIKHRPAWYLPDDDYCFDRLLAAHADAFRIVFQDSNLRIFEVVRQPNLSFAAGPVVVR